MHNLKILIVSLIFGVVVFVAVFALLNQEGLFGKDKTTTKQETTLSKLEVEQQDLFMTLQAIQEFEISTTASLETPKQLDSSSEEDFLASLKIDIDNYVALQTKLTDEIADTKPLVSQYEIELGDAKEKSATYTEVLNLVNTSQNTLQNSQKEVVYLNDLVSAREDLAIIKTDTFLARVKQTMAKLKATEISLFTSSFLDKYFSSYPATITKDDFIAATQI